MTKCPDSTNPQSWELLPWLYVKASSSLHPPQNYDDNRRTRSSRTFLGDAIVRIFKSFPSRKTSNKAALPPQHRLHQRRQHPRPHIGSIGSSRLYFDHFQRQKNDRKSDTVTQWRTSDPIMCPVKLWASIITRILSYKGTNQESHVSLSQHRNKTSASHRRWSQIFSKIASSQLVKKKLGIHRSEVGTHSIRSGAAMAMYLAGVPIFSIMLIGRWLSLTFLKYIRKQVQEFSFGISLQTFKHINNPLTTNTTDSIVGDSSSLLMG